MKQTQSLANDTRKKRRILLGTLIPLTVIGVALGVALPLTMCHQQSASIKIIYADEITISETAGTAGRREFEVFDNADNPINDATISFTPDIQITGFSTGLVHDNHYEFAWSSLTAIGSYHITITATTPNGLSASFSITLDITPQSFVILKIDSTNFSTYLDGTSPIADGYKQDFIDFLNNNNVNKIVFDIPNISIGDFAFAGCALLSNPQKPIAIEFNSATISSIGAAAFQGCASISQIICSSATTTPTIFSIGNYAFDGCANLTGFSRGNNAGQITINSIDNGAFAGCADLNVSQINTSIISSLGGCTWTAGNDANSGYWRKGSDSYLYSAGCLAVGKISCPFTSIGTAAFYGCASLVEINDLPGGSIGTDAFLGCASLQTVKFDRIGANKTTSIGNSAFAGCAALKSIQLLTGSTVTGASIGTNAFYGCANSGGTISGTDAATLLYAIHLKDSSWLQNWTTS